MKRALSLLLTLAMVMSFFTVGAFATGGEGDGEDGGGSSTPPTLAVSVVENYESEIVTGVKTKVKAEVTYAEPEGYSHKYTYTWTVSGDGLTGAPTAAVESSAKSHTIELTGATAGNYTVKCDVTVTATPTGGEASEPVPVTTDPVTVTVEADNYELKLLKADNSAASVQNITLAPNGTGELTVKAELWDNKGTTASDDDVKVNETVTLTVKDTTVATLSGSTVTAKEKGGSTKVEASVTYKGKTYGPVTVANITVKSLGIEKTVTNGSSVTYPATSTSSNKSFVDAVAADIKTATGAETAPTISTLKLTVPSSSIFTAYKDTKTTANKLAAGEQTLDTTKALIFEATAGSIDTEEWTYKATVGETVYEGTLSLTSDYADTITDYQNADFTKEWFFLESISGISEVREYSSSVKSYSESNVTSTTSYKVTPKYTDTDWTLSLIGYTSSEVAYLVDVKFTAAVYDILTYTEDGETPFESDDFAAFVENVAYEQDVYYDVALEEVKFTTTSATNKWELKKGSSKLSTSTKLSATELEAITIDVKTAGIYYVPFTADYSYKTSSSGSWSTSTKSYSGVVCVYATAAGDIQYDVSCSDSVTFDVADFQAFYKTASNNTSAKLDRVVFTGAPLYGDLYTVPNKYTSSYRVDSSDVFHADPTSSEYDLADVTYWADSTPKTEYSVYIPFTAYGNRTSQSGVVEIIVNGALPFTDVKETDTFYTYIKYVYDNNIMNGKTTTKFDASSKVTRIQLVTTLYRMAGSPTTYNRKTLDFTDATGLSTEFTNALKWAVNTGLVNGYGKTFKPNDAVTRQAMVTILYRFADYYGYDVSVYSNNNLASFKDAAKVSASMKTAMNWAVDCGFVSGNNNQLMPGNSTTRGACAKILATFHDWYIG